MGWLQFRDPVSAWSHCAGVLFAPAATWALWRASGGDWAKRGAFLVFGVTLSLCYGCSTIFHAVRLPPLERRLFATLDYIGVYLFIAGSVTPLAVIVLRGAWRWGILALAWGMALGGVAVRLLPVEWPRLVSTGSYIGMGWGVLLCYVQLTRLLPPRALWPVVLGGLFYSTGAAIDLLNAPTLVPGLFGPHELFHCFVLAGTLVHTRFLFRVVAPYGRSASSRPVVSASLTPPRPPRRAPDRPLRTGRATGAGSRDR